MPRVVLDTNVLVSAFLFYDRGGLPAELLRHAREQRFTLVASEAMLDELEGFSHAMRGRRTGTATPRRTLLRTGRSWRPRPSW